MLTKDVGSTAIQTDKNIYAHKKTRALTDIPVTHDIEEVKGQQVHGLSFRVTDEAAAKQLYSSPERRFPDTCIAFRNQDFVDVVPYGCSKGKALLKLKRLTNLGSYYGIGGSYNGIPMLQDADISSTFHAPPKRAREATNRLVDPVGEAIRSYTLRRRN